MEGIENTKDCTSHRTYEQLTASRGIKLSINPVRDCQAVITRGSVKRVAINSLIFHSGGCTSGRDSREQRARGTTEGEKAVVTTSKPARGKRRKRKRKIEMEREKRERERGGRGKGEGEGHFKHCPLVRKLNFESRTGH